MKEKVPYIHTSSTFWRFWQEAGGGRSREAASFFLKMSILAALGFEWRKAGSTRNIIPPAKKDVLIDENLLEESPNAVAFLTRLTELFYGIKVWTTPIWRENRQDYIYAFDIPYMYFHSTVFAFKNGVRYEFQSQGCQNKLGIPCYRVHLLTTRNRPQFIGKAIAFYIDLRPLFPNGEYRNSRPVLMTETLKSCQCDL